MNFSKRDREQNQEPTDFPGEEVESVQYESKGYTFETLIGTETDFTRFVHAFGLLREKIMIKKHSVSQARMQSSVA